MFFINLLKLFCPPYWFYKKNYFLAKKEAVLLPKNKRVFIFLAANYGNLGDIAITYAQHILLQTWKPNYSIVEVPANCTYSYLKGIITQITTEDIITFVGGGNMGDLYPLYENLRQVIVNKLPNNQIIQFPFTSDYSKTLQGYFIKKAAKRIYGNHKNIKFLAREEMSSKNMSSLLRRHIETVPDIVLTLDYFREKNKRSGISICLRNDKEKLLSEDNKSEILDYIKSLFNEIEVTDTIIEDKLVSLANKEYLLNKYLEKLSDKRIVITDRLHGMIFAYITGTPAIVFCNSNKKVQYCYEWIKNCGYIFYIDEYEKNKFINLLNLALKVQPNRQKFEKNKHIFCNMIIDAL